MASVYNQYYQLKSFLHQKMTINGYFHPWFQCCLFCIQVASVQTTHAVSSSVPKLFPILSFLTNDDLMTYFTKIIKTLKATSFVPQHLGPSQPLPLSSYPHYQGIFSPFHWVSVNSLRQLNSVMCLSPTPILF